MKELSKVEVIWKDAFDGPQGWVLLSSYAPEQWTASTLGYTLDSINGPILEGYMTLCSSYFYSEDGELYVSNPVHIPNDWVKTIRTVI